MKSLKNTLLKLASVLFLCFFMFSCSRNIDDKDKKIYIEYTVETLSSSQLVNMLLIQNNFDKKQLSRILGCSIHTLERIQNGETVFTTSGELQAKTILKEVFFAGKIKQLDPEKGFWNSLKYGTFWTHSFNEEFQTSVDWKWEELVEE